MKILSQKMYDRETKDTEIFVQFTDKELNEFARESGFIQEEYICMTDIKSFKLNINKKNMSGVIAVGMQHNKVNKIGFSFEYTLNEKYEGCYKIDVESLENRKMITYEYDKNLSLATIQKRFLLQVIKDGLLKY